MLIGGGGVFGFWTIRQNRDYPVWVPLAINSELPPQKRADLAKELKAKLSNREILAKISKELTLTKDFGLATDEAVADELAKRLFVDVGEIGTPQGASPALNIGFSGKKKDKEATGKAAIRLMDEVAKILGIELKKP